MINALLIFLGAGLGGVSRYGIASLIYDRWGTNFPYGTLIINMSGSFLMGLLFVCLFKRYADYGASLQLFLLVGFLGGYTTFSAFSLDMISLLEKGQWLSAGLYVFLSVIGCVLLAWCGVLLGTIRG